MQEISQIMERLYYIPNSDLDGLPTLEFFGNLHLEGGYIRSHNSIEHSLYKYRPAYINIDQQTPIHLMFMKNHILIMKLIMHRLTLKTLYTENILCLVTSK